jgi:hypothetical protein
MFITKFHRFTLRWIFSTFVVFWHVTAVVNCLVFPSIFFPTFVEKMGY